MSEKLNAGREKSMNAITETALELLREKSLGDISVSELCERAGVTRKTFYRNFESKEAVIEYSIDALFGVLIKEFDISEATVTSVFEYCYELLLRDRDFAHIFTVDEITPVIVKRIERCVELSFNESLHNSGSFDPTLSDYYMAFIAVGIHTTVGTWVKGGCRQSPRIMARLTQHLLSGVIA